MDIETKRQLKQALRKSKFANGRKLSKKERAVVIDGFLSLRALKETSSKTFGTYKLENIVNGKADYATNETRKRSKLETKSAGISTVLQGLGFTDHRKPIN